MVDITGLNKAVVLKALHDNSKAQGMSFMHLRELSLSDCQSIIDGGTRYFDYLAGKVIKVDLTEDSFNPSLYDRDNGDGAAQRAVNSIVN